MHREVSNPAKILLDSFYLLSAAFLLGVSTESCTAPVEFAVEFALEFALTAGSGVQYELSSVQIRIWSHTDQSLARFFGHTCRDCKLCIEICKGFLSHR